MAVLHFLPLDRSTEHGAAAARGGSEQLRAIAGLDAAHLVERFEADVELLPASAGSGYQVGVASDNRERRVDQYRRAPLVIARLSAPLAGVNIEHLLNINFVVAH